MKVTNRFNLPEPLVKAITWDSHPRTGFSVTDLIQSPRITQLTRRHWDEIEGITPKQTANLVVATVVAMAVMNTMIKSMISSTETSQSNTSKVADYDDDVSRTQLREARRTSWIRELASILLVAAIIVRFAYWQTHPSLLPASIFWVLFLSSLLLYIVTEDKRHWLIHRIGIFIGSTLNAAVTLVNGGFMPVVGESHSIWVTSTECHQLLFLSDRFAGFSIGDFVLTGSILMILGYKLVEEIRNHS